MSLPVTLSDSAVDEITCVAHSHTHSLNQWCSGNTLGQINTCFTPTTHTLGDSQVCALAFHPLHAELAVAHNSELKIHRSEGDSSGYAVVFAAAVRFTMPITCVQYSATGQHIFVSSQDDSGIAVYACSSRTVELKIDTLSSGVRSFAVDSSGTYLAIITMDGTVLIHKLIYEEGPVRRQYQAYDMVCVKNSAISKELCRNTTMGVTVSFQPTTTTSAATQVAFAHQDGAALLLSRSEKTDDWSEKHFLVTSDDSDFSHGTSDVHMTAFSPNGRYLLTADVAGRVIVWSARGLDSTTGSIDAIKMLQIEDTDEDADECRLRHMQFGPDEGDNYVILVTAEKEGKVEPIINTSLGYPAPTGEVVEATQAQVEDVVREKPTPAATPTHTHTVPPVTTMITAGKRLKKGSTEGAEGDGSDGDDDIFDVNVTELKEQYKSSTLEGDNSAPIEVDDAGNDHGDSEGVLDGLEALLSEGGKDYMDKLAKLLEQDGPVGGPIAPPPFQPSSTFPNNKHSQQNEITSSRSRLWHYFVWNSVGSITCLNEDTNNRIEISFSDVNGPNKAVSFDDTDMFTRASLSMYGAAFTSDIQKGEGGDKIPSVLLYRAFHSTSTGLQANESFRYALPAGEGAIAVACGRGFVAVATSKNLLRVFSATGLQLSVSMLKGPLMALVGGGNYLAVMHYTGVQVDRHQSLMMRAEVFDITPAGARLAAAGEMLLRSRETITWANVTETGMLCICEKNGTLYGLMYTMGGQWIPLLDTKPLIRTDQHLLWPVAVKDNKLCFVMLNGETRPGVHPKPVVTARPFRLPTIDALPKGNVENDRVRTTLWESNECAHLGHIQQQHAEAIRREGSGACSVSVPESMLSASSLEDTLDQTRLELDKANLRQFHECCKTQRLAVALDIITRLQTISGLNSAITIANHTGRTHLAQLVEDIISEREQQEEQYANEVQYNQNGSQYPTQTVPESQGYMSPQYGDHDDYESQSQSQSQLARSGSLNLNRFSDSQQAGNVRKAPAFNPFATNKTATHTTPSPVAVAASNTFHTTSQKEVHVTKTNHVSEDSDSRKRIHESLVDSPAKKPLLSRDTSFSQEARWKKHNDVNAI